MANQEILFDVTLSDGIGTNPIGLMDEIGLEGWLASRPLEDSTEHQVLAKLHRDGAAIVYFRPVLGPRQRVEIEKKIRLTDEWEKHVDGKTVTYSSEGIAGRAFNHNCRRGGKDTYASTSFQSTSELSRDEVEKRFAGFVSGRGAHA